MQGILQVDPILDGDWLGEAHSLDEGGTLRRRFITGRFQIQAGHIGPFLGKPQGACPANAVGCAGHQRDLSYESFHLASPTMIQVTTQVSDEENYSLE